VSPFQVFTAVIKHGLAASGAVLAEPKRGRGVIAREGYYQRRPSDVRFLPDITPSLRAPQVVTTWIMINAGSGK
jgi:hypothetical protein